MMTSPTQATEAMIAGLGAVASHDWNALVDAFEQLAAAYANDVQLERAGRHYAEARWAHDRATATTGNQYAAAEALVRMQ